MKSQTWLPSIFYFIILKIVSFFFTFKHVEGAWTGLVSEEVETTLLDNINVSFSDEITMQEWQHATQKKKKSQRDMFYAFIIVV